MIVTKPPIVLAMRELLFYDNNQELVDSSTISKRLRPFFQTDDSKTQFLYQLLWIAKQQLELDKNFYIKLKILILLHIIISSETARCEFSKLLLNHKIDLNLKTREARDVVCGHICQQYYCYLYKLAANTTLINEDITKPQEDLMIYFTLANQCYIGLAIQEYITQFTNFKESTLMSNITKFLYQDTQDIYVFILKDIKYFMEQKPGLIQNKEQMLELYKECHSLQDKLLTFYRFNCHFAHCTHLMPPQSIIIKSQLINKVEETSKPMLIGQFKSFSVAMEQKTPATTKHAAKKQFQFPEERRPQSPQNAGVNNNQFNN